jgi:hypothetical protein
LQLNTCTSAPAGIWPIFFHDIPGPERRVAGLWAVAAWAMSWTRKATRPTVAAASMFRMTNSPKFTTTTLCLPALRRRSGQRMEVFTVIRFDGLSEKLRFVHCSGVEKKMNYSA